MSFASHTTATASLISIASRRLVQLLLEEAKVCLDGLESWKSGKEVRQYSSADNNRNTACFNWTKFVHAMDSRRATQWCQPRRNCISLFITGVVHCQLRGYICPGREHARNFIYPDLFLVRIQWLLLLKLTWAPKQPDQPAGCKRIRNHDLTARHRTNP
jgi:hypothetical protein